MLENPLELYPQMTPKHASLIFISSIPRCSDVRVRIHKVPECILKPITISTNTQAKSRLMLTYTALWPRLPINLSRSSNEVKHKDSAYTLFIASIERRVQPALPDCKPSFDISQQQQGCSPVGRTNVSTDLPICT